MHHVSCVVAVSSLYEYLVLLRYLVSFLLDSTAGLLIIYLLLKAVAWLVGVFELKPLVSGVYGKAKRTKLPYFGFMQFI